MRAGSFLLVITFLCSLVAETHEANRKFAERVLGSELSSKIEDIDEDTAEQLWIHCRKELQEILKVYDYTDYYIQPPGSKSQDMMESDLGILKKRILHKAITDLPSHCKETLLNCLDKEFIRSQSPSRNSALIDWHKLFFEWSGIPRRYLEGEMNAPQRHQHHKHTGIRKKPGARRARVPNPLEPLNPRATSNAPALPENVRLDRTSSSLTATNAPAKSENVRPDRTSSSLTATNAPVSPENVRPDRTSSSLSVTNPPATPENVKPDRTSSSLIATNAPAKPENVRPAEPESSLTTSNVKDEKSSAPGTSETVTSPKIPKDLADVTAPRAPTSLFEAFAIRQIEKALEQMKTKATKSPAPQPPQQKGNNSPSPSSTEKSKSPAPSPQKRSKSPAPSPSEKSKSPAPSPQKRSKSPAPSPSEKNKSPAPSPSDKSKSPAPSPSEKSKSPAPSPSEKSKSPAPSPSKKGELPEISPAKPQPMAKNKKSKNKKSSVIVGCYAAGALVVAFCLICGARSAKKKEYGQSDDKHFSYLSTGSLQTPNGVANGSSFNSVSATPGASGRLSGASVDGSLPLPPGRAPPHPAPKAAAAAPPPPPPAPPSPPAPAPPPPPAPPEPPAPKAPPPPKAAPPPQPPKPSPLGPKSTRLYGAATEGSEDQKAKLKPFHWDKVAANPDQTMVWHDLKAGSFQVNEETMENLFGYKAVEQQKNKKGGAAFEAPKYIQIIDPRKAQNLAILLKALNVTNDEVCDAILDGNELPTELIQTLLKMAPTSEEELKLRLYDGDLSQLGPAERFLKTMVEIPLAFKRLEFSSFMYSVEEEISSVKESFASIEVACNEIKSSRLFLKLLEAVLKTGNRMNDGTYRGGAQAFKLDTLLKLSDVKGIDGKTTLLHFVVLEIIRTEGIRAARRENDSSSLASVKTEDMLEKSSETAEYVCNLGIEIVSNLRNELENVQKAAHIDSDVLRSTVIKLGNSLKKSKEFLNNEMDDAEQQKGKFRERLESFVHKSEDEIEWLLEEEKKMSSLIQSTVDYFHGNAGKDEGLRLFAVVRDFLGMVERVVNEVKRKAQTTKKVPSRAPAAAQESPKPKPQQNLQQRLFPAIIEQRRNDSDSSSSDDDS